MSAFLDACKVVLCCRTPRVRDRDGEWMEPTIKPGVKAGRWSSLIDVIADLSLDDKSDRTIDSLYSAEESNTGIAVYRLKGRVHANAAASAQSAATQSQEKDRSNTNVHSNDDGDDAQVKEVLCAEQVIAERVMDAESKGGGCLEIWV